MIKGLGLSRLGPFRGFRELVQKVDEYSFPQGKASTAFTRISSELFKFSLTTLSVFCVIKDEIEEINQ